MLTTVTKHDTNKNIIDLSKPLLVCMESFSSLKDAQVVSDDGRKLFIKYMTFDTLSRNNNEYPVDDTKKSFAESTYVNENLINRTWFGELEHPPADATLDRFLYVEPTRYAWNIKTLKDCGDCFSGEVELANPLGTSIVQDNIVRFGSNYASSCRIYTPKFVEKMMNGKKIYIKKYRMFPVTFDCVTMPGLPACRLVDSNKYKSFHSSESASHLSVIKFDNPETTLRKMMKSEENARILEDYFNVDFEKSAVLMKNGKIKLSTENGNSVIVPINRHLVREVLG